MPFGPRIVLLILAANCAVIFATAEGSRTTQDIREEDLDVIEELQSKQFNENDVKEIEKLLSTNTEDDTSSKPQIKTSLVEKNSYTRKQNSTIKDMSVELTSSKMKTKKPIALKVEQNSLGKNTTSEKKSDESTRSMLDAIVHRIMSQYDRKAVGKDRPQPNTASTDTKSAGTSKYETLSSLGESNAQKIAERSKSFLKLKTNTTADTKNKQNDRDKIVFSRLESIAHNILRVLKDRERTSEGSKLRMKINRQDLLEIRDFIRTTRNPGVDRNAKVHSAKQALVAIKNLMKLIKKNKLGTKGNSKIGDAFKEAQAIDSKAFMKSKVPKDEKNLSETEGKKSGSSKDKNSHEKHDKKYYLKKLKDFRVKLLKEKLLKVLKLREGDNLNLDLKRLKTKLESQVLHAKREKRDAEQEKSVRGQEIRKEPAKREREKVGKRKVQKRKHAIRKQTKINRNKKASKISHGISKEFKKVIRKKIKKLNVIMDKGENERGAKRFELVHGHKSFRKNLISLANLDASKMTDEDLKKLHDKINEWIEVEEKLERETENGEVKDEISSGINTANDLLSSLKFVGEDSKDGYEKKINVNGGEKGEKKSRNLEITIDINKHGKDKHPSVKIVKNNQEVANVGRLNGKEQVSNMYSDSDSAAMTNPSQSVAVDDGATNTNSPYEGNQEWKMYTSNDNVAATEPSHSNSPEGTPSSGSTYLKEMARAYMDGKAIKDNNNFGEKLRKMEENFENDLNNMENNNNNDKDNINNNNIIDNNSNNKYGNTINNKSYNNYDNNNNNNNNIYGNTINNKNYNNNNYGDNNNNNKYGNTINKNYNNNNNYGDNNNNNKYGNTINNKNYNNNNYGDNNNNKENVNNFIPNKNTINDKGLKPGTENAQNVGDFVNTNSQQGYPSFGKNGQTGNDYITNDNNLNNNGKMNGEHLQQIANSKENKNLPGSNPLESNGGTYDESTGNVANKDGKSNRWNGDMGKSFGNNLNGVSGQNEEAMNGDLVTKGGQRTSDSQVGDSGQSAEEIQAGNDGKVANTGQVAYGDQVTNVGKFSGQITNQGILPNGHVITNEADLASQQAKQVNKAEDSDNNNINKAAYQLANTMNQGNPASNQRGTGEMHGAAEIKTDQPKVNHFAKKPKTVNPDYDDQDYDYTEADEEEAEDEKILAEQKKLPKNRTPFLESNRLNKFVQQRIPNTPEPGDQPRQNSLRGYDESPNEIQQNHNRHMNQILNNKNGRPGRVFYRLGKPVLHQNGYRKFAARFRNRQKQLNFQRLNGKLAQPQGQGNYRVDNAERTGKYHHNLANNGKFSDEVSPQNSEVQRFAAGEHGHLGQTGYSTQQAPTPKSTYGSSVEENEMESNGKDNENMSGSILNGKLMKDDGMNEIVPGNRANGGSTLKGNTMEENVQRGVGNSGNTLNGKTMKDDRMNENANTGIKTPEHDITAGENIPEVDSSSREGTVQNAKSMQPQKLHGKALLNNFLDEETLKASHTSKNAPQGLNTSPQRDESSEEETEELDSGNEDSTERQDSSKNPQGLHQGSNSGPGNSQVLSAESDGTDSSEGTSDDENSDDDAPTYSATLIDDDEMNSSSDVEPSMQENAKHHWHRHRHNKKARHRLLQYRHKNLRRLRHRNRHLSAIRQKMVHERSKHFKNDDNLQQTVQDKQYNIHNLKKLVNKKFSKHKAFMHLPKQKQHKANIDLQKIPDAEAIIRGAIRTKPTQVIHVVKDVPKPIMTQAKNTKFVTDLDERVSNDAVTSGMPKLQNVKVKLGPLGKKTSPEGAKFIVKQSPSTDQLSQSSADSTSGGGGEGGGGGGGGGGDVGGFETSGIALPGSQVTTQSLMGEDKVSNLNANDVTSSSDGGAMMSSSDNNGMTPSNGGTGMMSPSDADRMATSDDPTELTEYEHNVDIQERTGAGDIVPVGMSSSSPAITPGSNMPAGPPPGGAAAPPEHVLLSPNSAKGENLLKPLANDPDGKLQALQDLRALTKAQREEETSATEDSNKISDPGFLEEMSNRISVSGAPINSLGVTHTPTMPIRDIEQPESTLVIPGEKLKRDEKGSSHKTSFQEKNAQFSVDNKVVALGAGTEKFPASPKAGQIQQFEGGAPQLHLTTPKPEKSSQGAALAFSQHNPDITNNLAPKITELVQEIVRESLGRGQKSMKKKEGKATEEILDDPSKDAAVLLKSEKMETKPYGGIKNLGSGGRGPGTGHRVSPQAHIQAENSKETVFLPNVPPNAEGDHVLFGSEPQPTNDAGTMNILSKSNLSNKEKVKLINEYKASQKSSAEPSVPSKTESPTTTPTEVDESKITEMLKSGKFSEQDLKSDFAGKEAAMQDMMMLEKEQDLDNKLSQAHIQASQASKQNGPGNGLPPGSQKQENAMSTPGNLSPDITLPGNVVPGASLPETLPAGMTPPGDGLSSDVALPENRPPGAGGQVQMSGFQNQMQSGQSKDEQFMMAKDTQMDRLLDQAQEGLPKGMGGENSAGMIKSTKAPQSKLNTGFNDAVKSFDDNIGHNEPNYDAVDPKGISKFVDTVQGLSPAEVKAYGIDVNNDVYIDKPALRRPAAQRSQQLGYTTMGAELGRDMESFDSIRKSKVSRKKSRKS